MRLKPFPRVVYVVLAVSWLGNGAWMLFAPAHWFVTIPGASDTGPFNPHLVRDFGVAFAVIGGATLMALVKGAFGYAQHLWVMAFFALHGGVHVWELLAGYTHPHIWWLAFPWVFGETMLLLILSLPRAWKKT